MKKVIFTFTFVFAFLTGFSQTISLQECYQKAMNNYPLVQNTEFLKASVQYNLSNAIKGWLPSVNLTGKATYQSDITQLPVSVPNIDVPQLKKDQYNIALEVTQTIFDGGQISSQQNLIKSQNEVLLKQQEVDLYALKERINQIYFGILALDEQIKQNNILQEELNNTKKKIDACINNGIANQSDADRVKVEQINVKQQYIQLTELRTAYLNMLGAFINENLDGTTQLEEPVFLSDNIAKENNRPEIAWFEAQKQFLQVQENNLKSSYLPKLSAFAQGGYGRPALNMLSSDFDFYYIVGLRLNWNLHSLYTNKNDKALLQNSRKMAQMNKETFLFNSNLNSLQQQSAISSLEKQMLDDEQIILLRSSIRQSAEIRVENGTMSVSDLLSEINNENMAKQNQRLHKIQLLQKQYELKTLLNN